MTVSLARPGGCWLAPKNMVLAGAEGASILLPQLPQKRLSAGTSAPQVGQSLPDMFVLTSAWRRRPGPSIVGRGAGKSSGGAAFPRPSRALVPCSCPTLLSHALVPRSHPALSRTVDRD